MKKTDTYRLNQWEISDRIRMEDFNADNVQLEAALAGKTGRFQFLKDDKTGGGKTSLGYPFYIYEDEWVNWECVMAFFDPGKTAFLADDYMEIRMQTRVNYGSSDVIAKLSAGPFMVMLFPLHSGENLTRGIVVGKGSGAIVLDWPIQQVLGTGISLKNPNSTSILGASSTKLSEPVWSIYGMK
jgi:hypothetical protein